MHAIDSFFIGAFTGATAAVAIKIARRIKANQRFRQSVRRTIGEAALCKDSLSTNTIVRVQILSGGSSDQTVGLEFLTERFGGYRMLPMTLSQAEARKLADLLASTSEKETDVAGLGSKQPVS